MTSGTGHNDNIPCVCLCTSLYQIVHVGVHTFYKDFSLIVDSGDDTIGDLKKLIAAQTGTKAEKIVLKKW